MSNPEKSRASWLIPAVVAAVVTLLTTAITAGLQHWKDTTEDDRERKRIEIEDLRENRRIAIENGREVARVRSEVLKAASDSKSLLVAAVLLDHVLRPIDQAPDLPEFSKKIQDYIASLAAETATGGAARQELARVAPPASGDETSLVAKFEGPERLSASNALVERARDSKASVVEALLAAIRPPDAKLSYRVNLYVAFTLGRIPGGWTATPAQIDKLRKPTTSPFYADPTFKARLDEALRLASASR